MSTEGRKGGYTIDLEGLGASQHEDYKPIDENQQRDSKTFLLDVATPETIPESIVGNERVPNVSDFSLFKLKSLPTKGIKVFLYAVLVLLITLSVFEVIRVFKYVLSIHWILAILYSALLATIFFLGLRLVYRYIKDADNLSKLVGIQDKAERLVEGNDFGQAAGFVEELRDFYKQKPQEKYFQRCIDQMPDYSNDREALQHINAIFIKPLDDEAIRRISTYCVQTGVAVAVSPWASLDMLLSLWRSSQMIDDVAQVYGMRPSLPNRLRLLRKVVHQLIFVGVTELLLEGAFMEFGIQGLTGKLSARAGQGIGAGLYTAKIGIAAMKVTRPITFKEEERPKLSDVAAEMMNKLTSIFSKKESEKTNE